MFSNGRENANDFPGAFVYHCRGGDTDPGALITLEHRVLVNHSGTVISAVEIPFKNYILLGDTSEDTDAECHYNFLDNEMTYSDYISSYSKRVDVLPKSYTHINDCWKALEECETVAEAENLINDFPRKFGEWYIEKNMFGDGYTVTCEYEDDICVECDAQDFDWTDTDEDGDAIAEFNAMVSRGEFDFSDGVIEDSDISVNELEGTICPKCGNRFTDPPAISRDPGGAEICPDCGMKEALAAYIAGGDADE